MQRVYERSGAARSSSPGPNVPPRRRLLITVAAGDRVRPIHSRMPLILDPADFDVWLSADTPPVELLTTPKTDALEAVPVSSWVNSPTHDDARCMEPKPMS